eukprot:6644179-Alexandrium_andersonii.AAC.1
MSASLVGSEMCIRDRLQTVSNVHTCYCCRPPRPGSAGGGRKLQEHGAVSYTHLTLPTICSV